MRRQDALHCRSCEADTRGRWPHQWALILPIADDSCLMGYSLTRVLETRADDELTTPANMPLQHCAIAISFSVSFGMSCRRRASSSKSQAARASTSLEPERVAERHGVGEGHRRHECARADGLGRLAITLADRFGRWDHLHQHGAHFTLGRDAWIDQGCGRDPSSDGAVLSLWPIQTRRIGNDPEQPGVRPKPSRLQPGLGSARPRSSRSDRAIRRIFGSDNHRNARKQSERENPPNSIRDAALASRRRTTT